jgi:hypothetical protein
LQGCPWDERTCEFAAAFGKLDCLRYAHEHGCPWDERTCEFAAYDGHFDCLKYAHDNGCPYPDNLRTTIVREVLMPKWREVVRVRPIAVYWDELAGRASHSEGGEGRKRDREAYEADFGED